MIGYECYTAIGYGHNPAIACENSGEEIYNYFQQCDTLKETILEVSQVSTTMNEIEGANDNEKRYCHTITLLLKKDNL